MEQAMEEDVALHTEVATIRGLLERFATEGRSIEAMSIAELRAEGLSSEAIELLLAGSAEDLRRVIGAPIALMVKRGSPFGP